MNSFSNTNCHDHRDDNRDDHRDCHCPPRFDECDRVAPLHPVPGAALLECGRSFNPIINTNINPASPFPTAPFQVAEVEIDTSCFCFANTKIEFSSLLNLAGSAFAGDEAITVRLTRECCGFNGFQTKARTLEDFVINLPEVAAVTVPESLPFSFIFCDENVPLAECTYSVNVIAATGFNAGEFVQFLNTDIAALAVGGAQKCHR